MFPILSAYRGIGGLDFGSVILFTAGMLCLCTNFKQFKLTNLPKGYGVFYIVAMIVSIVFIKSLQLRLSLFTINLVFACSFFDINLIIKYYLKTVKVCCAFFLIQELMYYFTGARISGILTFLPTIYGDASTGIINRITTLNRSSSFFLEPSYFAQFLFPYVVYFLFSKKKADIKKAVLVSFIMLVTKSGNGLILLLIIWCGWFFFSDIKTYQKCLLVLLVTLFLCGLLIVDNSLIFMLLERMSELQSYGGEERHMSSGFIRFFRGYYLYDELPMMNQLFGANNNVVELYMSENIFFPDEEDKFLNGVQTILVHNGLFILILYIRHILLWGRQSSDIRIKIFIFCIIFLMLGESYYLTSRLFFVTIFLFGLCHTQTTKSIKLYY